jgi:hypothetical protein
MDEHIELMTSQTIYTPPTRRRTYCHANAKKFRSPLPLRLSDDQGQDATSPLFAAATHDMEFAVPF